MRCNILLLARGLALAALVLCLGGCGTHQFDMTGQVKYNGAVLAKPDGQIVFIGPDGSQVGAPIGLDGTYTAVKVTAGLNRVAVYYPNPAFVKKAKRARPVQGAPPPPTNQPLPAMFLTPESYASPDTSQLSIQVDQDTAFNVDLTGPPIR
jgi:hypothetical protein